MIEDRKDRSAYKFKKQTKEPGMERSVWLSLESFIPVLRVEHPMLGNIVIFEERSTEDSATKIVPIVSMRSLQHCALIP